MSEDALTQLIRTARGRAAASSLLAGGARGLACGATLMLAAALCHRFLIPLAPAVPVALLLVPLVLGLAAGWRRRPDAADLATSLDRRFDTRSLISSAWSIRTDATTPAARLVLEDARRRAMQWQAQLRAALPLTAPRSAAASLVAVLVASVLLAHPGATPRTDDGDVGADVAAAHESERSHETPHAGSPARTAVTTGARTNGATAGEPGEASAAGTDRPVGGSRETPAAPGAGDAPGRATAVAAAPPSRDTDTPVRWIDRERRGDGAGAGAADPTATDAEVPAAETSLPPAALAAASAGQAPYEPVLPPAVAAYARAAARAEGTP